MVVQSLKNDLTRSRSTPVRGLARRATPMRPGPGTFQGMPQVNKAMDHDNAIGMEYLLKLDRVGPVDNRPSTDKLHHFVQKKM